MTVSDTSMMKNKSHYLHVDAAPDPQLSLPKDTDNYVLFLALQEEKQLHIVVHCLRDHCS